jgi:hypothetical protein
LKNFEILSEMRKAWLLLTLLWGSGAEELCPSTGQGAMNITALTCEELTAFLAFHSEQVALKFEEAPRPLLLGLIHLVGTLSLIRSECITESFRFIAMLLIRDGMAQLSSLGEMSKDPISMFSENVKRLVKTELPTAYYSHEHDGRLTTLEAMRIRIFHEQPFFHLCALRFGIKDIFKEGDSVVEVGAGPEAVHSEWLNKTGLVKSVAVDNFPETAFVTNGQVIEIDFRNEITLRESGLHADWVLALDANVDPSVLMKGLSPRKGLIVASEIGKTLSNSTMYDEPLSAKLDTVCNSTEHHYYVFISN